MATEIKDPGIGTQFKQKTQRIIAQDGSYNLIKRGGQNGFRDVFKYLLEISWWWFFTLLFLGYILINLVFGGAYYLIGIEHITGIDPSTSHPFLQCFFFSGQTFTTVGYGALAPTGLPTQILATVEAFFGLLSFSVATGIAYSRFSKPNSKIIYSKHVLHTNYQDGKSIKFKLANERNNVLLEVSAKVILTLEKVLDNGDIIKSYYNLKLETDAVELLPYTWTLVYKIDENSPLFNLEQEEIRKLNPEFLILLKGFDETFSQHIRSKRSFVVDDILWDREFAKIFAPNTDGIIEFDVKDINKLLDNDDR
jgi:inward rectifier potassium channel